MGRGWDSGGDHDAAAHQVARLDWRIDLVLVGELSLWIALLMAIWAASASVAGASDSAVGETRQALIASGERGIHATLAFLVLASAGLLAALVTHDLSLKHVAAHTAANLPGLYVLAGFWASGAGSVLLWSLIVAVAATVTVSRRASREPYATAMLGAALVLFIAVAAVAINPFERLSWTPPDGAGLRPDLQTPAFAIYPPLLYSGLLLSVVPFALCVGHAVRRGASEAFLLSARRWAVLAWTFTTIGILGSMWWKYSVDGWVANWAAYPLRNATLFAWLALTAPAWRLQLVTATTAFLLSVFAAMVVRADYGSGLQAFVRSYVVVVLLALVVAAALASLVLAQRHGVLSRWPSSGDRHPPLPLILALIGLTTLLAGVAGSALRTDYRLTVPTGGDVTVDDPFGRDWRFASEGISRYDVVNRRVTAVVLAAYRGRARAGLLTSEIRQYVDSRGAPTFSPLVKSGILGSPAQALHAALLRAEDDERAVLRVSFQPLVRLVWLGGALLVFAGLLALWPRRRTAGA